MANLLRTGDRAEANLSSTNKQPISSVLDGGVSKKADRSALNTWDVAQRWIQNVSKEESTRKQWEQMYGWMADYDSKGNFNPRERTFENASRFSNTIPNSRGHDYGWHLQNDLGKEISTLQARFNNQHKRRRSDVILGSD